MNEETTREDIISRISAIDSMNHVSELLEDEDVDEALFLILEVIRDPKQFTPHKATSALVFLTAVYAKLKVDARFYMTLAPKSTPRLADKKNVTLSLADAILELINSMKYVAKN